MNRYKTVKEILTINYYDGISPSKSLNNLVNRIENFLNLNYYIN